MTKHDIEWISQLIDLLTAMRLTDDQIIVILNEVSRMLNFNCRKVRND